MELIFTKLTLANMKNNFPLTFLTFTLLMILSGCDNSQKSSHKNSNASFDYPETRQDEVVDEYFGVKVNDPYRWLEDDRSEETMRWVKAQNSLTFEYLDNIPFRQAIADRLTKLWNFERYSAPFKRAGKYYYYKNDGLQNQSVLYVQDQLDGEAKVVLDPNNLSKDGTTSLAGVSISKDGKYMAYTISEGGSDWRKGLVRDLKTNKDLSDEVNWLKFTSLRWYKDGFFYSRYPEPSEEDKLSGENIFHQVYYHKIGTKQADDELVFLDRTHPKRTFYASVTKDDEMLLVYPSEGTSGNALYAKNLKKGETEFTPLIEDFDNDHSVVAHHKGKLLVLTNKNAPNLRLVEIDPKNPAVENWKDIIPQNDKNALESVQIIGKKLVAVYIQDVVSQVKVFEMNGKFLYDLQLPGLGTLGALRGDKDENQAFYTFSSYTIPTSIYQMDIRTGKSTLFKTPKIEFDLSQYETKRVFYSSLDGTKVPMFITHKKGIALDGTNPTLLYGYGGFNISVQPRFSIANLALLENGGVYAVANIRGGGEYGEKWHKAGTKLEKQNVFNDFIAAAEYLINKKYTTNNKLALQGGSNGGLLVGACMTQRPDLFKVALPAVGVLDMLRYHTFTIGWAWEVDYGSSADSTQFNNLLSYSPLHNVKEGVAYPATLVTTADHDDRVVPAHSFKFISELQAKHKGPNPVMIRIETSAGHGAGKPTDKVIEEAADKLAFMFHNMGEEITYDPQKEEDIKEEK